MSKSIHHSYLDTSWVGNGWEEGGFKNDGIMVAAFMELKMSLRKITQIAKCNISPMNIDIIIKLSLGHRGGRNPPQVGGLQKAS